MLFLCPQQLGEDSVPGAAKVTIFDCDGAVVSEAELGSSQGEVVAMEIDPLLERCKLESGMRHGQLMVEHGADVRPVCRFHNRAGAVMNGAAQPVTQDRALFSPVTLSPDRVSLMTLINHGDAEAQVRVRLMVGNRSPDVVYAIPAHGSKAVCLEKEFHEALTSGFGKNSARNRSTPAPVAEDAPKFPETRGYVRVSVRNELSIGAQLIECVERSEQGTQFTALSW